MAKIKIFIILVPAVLLAGAVIGFATGKVYYNKQCNAFNYQYLSSELGCSSKPVVRKHNYVVFKNKLTALLQQKKNSNEISTVSIYFRDLKQGPTFGLNEYDKYAPASLLKLPLMLTYLGLQEKVPDLSRARLYYKPTEQEIKQNFNPSQSLEENTSYTVDELLKYMIQYSDNKAYYLLLDYLAEISPDRDLLSDTYIDLGIADPQTQFENSITVKSYSSVFTQLYFASFLDDKPTSEKALEFLAQSDFKPGIRAGVPSSIQVANKFGERAGFDGDLKQLHDCGIVYYPGNPYLLCIMTQGYDFNKLAETISLISALTYEEFDSRKY